jgi:hypothetical protein
MGEHSIFVSLMVLFISFVPSLARRDNVLINITIIFASPIIFIGWLYTSCELASTINIWLGFGIILATVSTNLLWHIRKAVLQRRVFNHYG